MGISADYPQSVILVAHTATDDLKFTLATADLWLEDVNIHCTDNASYYGDSNTQSAVINTNDVISYRYINLAQLFFKNQTAGSNTTITAVGIPVTPKRRKELGIDVS